MINKNLYYLYMLMLCLACTSNKQVELVPYVKKEKQTYERVLTSYAKDDSKLVHDKVPLRIDDTETVIKWEIYESADNQLMFSIPSNWSIEEDLGSEIYCHVDQERKSFFILYTHSKIKYGVTIDSYLDILYDAYARDSSEVLLDMNVQELTLKHGVGYLLEAESLIDEIPYKSFSFFTEDRLNIYDFTLKTIKGDSAIFEKVIFEIVLSNFKINNQLIYNSLYKDVEIKKVDMGFRK